MKNEPALTGFRGLASILVVLHHYAARPPGTVDPRFPAFLLLELHAAVGFFFALSGFVLTRIYLDAVGSGAMPARIFLGKRLAKLYPVYLLFLLASVAVAFATEQASREGFGWDVFWHALLLHGAFDDLKFSLVPTAWAGSVELCFYLVLPATFIATVRGCTREGRFSWQRYLAFLVLLNLAFRALGHALEALDVAAFGFFRAQSHWLSFTLCGRILDFSLGSLAAMLILRAPSARLLARPGIATLASFAGLFVFVGAAGLINAVGGGRSAIGMHLHWLFALAASIFLWSLSGRSLFTPLFGGRFLVFAGLVSYPVYLLHFHELAQLPMQRLVKATGSPVGGAILVYLLCLGPAWVLHVLVEVPCKKLWSRVSSRNDVETATLAHDHAVSK